MATRLSARNNRLPLISHRAHLALYRHMPDDTQTRGIETTLYFGYGSNIWIEQMDRRCPDNKYIGLGVLRDW